MNTANPGDGPSEHDKAIAYTLNLIYQVRNREVTNNDLNIWSDMLSDLPPSLIVEAARALVRETSKYIDVASIRGKVGELWKTRMEAAESAFVPPSQLSTEQYTAWQRALHNALALGASDAEADAAARKAIGAAPAEQGALTAPMFTIRTIPTGRGGASR